MRSRGPPSASSTVSRDAPKPLSVKQPRQRCRPVAVGGQRQDARAGMEMRPDAGRARGHAATRSAVSGSAQPSRAAARLKADGAGTTSISSGVDMAREHRADAIEERIARGEHADLPAALREHLARRRARTGSATAARSPRISGAASARWRLPPNTISASAISAARDRRSGPRRHPRRCRRWTASGAVRQCARRADSADAMQRILILGGTTRSAATGRRACRAAPTST